MTISLFDVSVLAFRQEVNAIAGVLAKGRAHFEAAGISPDDIVAARVIEDMLPFRFQIHSVFNHSIGAIEGCKAGEFKPPSSQGQETYAALEAEISSAVAALAACTPDEVNALEGKDVVFNLGKTQMLFTAENFLMSFSLPNLYFHAATTYNILRAKGVKLGKRDYLGMPRLKM